VTVCNAISTAIFICILVVSSAAFTADEEVLYARYPALSPDNQTIAFTWQGDIWTIPTGGGEATRLTVHEAEDIRPHYSPDGRWLMFSSRRYNNYDVFIMPATGGSAKRLTVHSSDDFGSGWTPGSDSVIFTSHRNSRRDIYAVSIEGGTPVGLATTPWEHLYGGRISGDGTRLLFASGSGLSRWWRRDLRTAMVADLYVQDRTVTPFTSARLTNHNGHDLWPVLNWETNDVYFVSCRGDWAQVFRTDLSGLEATPITSFDGDGVQWLNSNPQGTQLVFEQGFKIWHLDPSLPALRSVPIRIATDERTNLIEHKRLTEDVEWFQLSPDGRKIVAVVHGELYLMPAEDPRLARRLTETSARERFPVWGPDSRTIYYASDRNGNYDIFALDATTGEERQLARDSVDETKPLVSPDGRWLVFYRGLRQIIRYDLDKDRESVWIEGPFLDGGVEMTTEYAWSPDSKWLAYTMGGPTFESNIYAADFEYNRYNVSLFVDWNYRPLFSPRGDFVYFTSNNRWDRGIYRVHLQPRPIEFDEAAIDSLFLDTGKGEEKGSSGTGPGRDSLQAAPFEVTIDTSRIDLRREKMVRLDAPGESPVVTPDGKQLLFVAPVLGKPEIWSVRIDEDDPNLTQITRSGKAKTQLQVSPDGKQVFYIESGNILSCEIESAKCESLPLCAELEVNTIENNRQKFREGWQMLNSYFYDTTFHGTNWDSVRARYQPVVDHIRSEEEFRNLFMELMGELRASHLHIYSREPGPAPAVRTGCLGVDWDYGALRDDGMLRIGTVLPSSAAARAGLKPGQVLLAVNDTPLGTTTSVHELLAGTTGRRVTVTVSDKPGGKTMQVELKPESEGAENNHRYEAWIVRNRAIVDSLSGGRLAYLHIRSMNQPALERFEQELVNLAEDKLGAIIDVRFNGGGWTAVHILGTLIKSPYIMRTFRGEPPTSENKMRSKAWERPLALLINSASGSNAEIFAEGFRKLALGPVIGTHTSGAVIGTSSYELIDGTTIRRPSWGAFTTDMVDTDLTPRQPDVVVEMLPDDYINERDPQLTRAVRELIDELDRR
jgi:tricorn protease